MLAVETKLIVVVGHRGMAITNRRRAKCMSLYNISIYILLLLRLLPFPSTLPFSLPYGFEILHIFYCLAMSATKSFESTLFMNDTH